jgi:hypothetical protein
MLVKRNINRTKDKQLVIVTIDKKRETSILKLAKTTRSDP